MFIKKIKFILILLIFYQTPLNSKSNSLTDYSAKNVSKYFSGIVAFENKNNSKALDFFNSSKILLNKHDPYLKRYVFSLVLENKVSQAITVIKNNKNKDNSNFFDAQMLLVLDSLKKNDFSKSYNLLVNMIEFNQSDKFNLAILESLKQYVYVFKEKKFLDDKKNLGKLSIISETFQRCYLRDQATDVYFSKLISDPEGDYSRYTFFYLTYLIENKKIEDAKKIVKDINYINSTLLLSQGKSWIENKKSEKLVKVFSCKKPNDLISEFFFLVANLYSSQNDYEKSNFYLNISNYLNPKFLFNLSLLAENYYLNKDYEKTKKVLRKFGKKDNIYYWFRLKKEAQIISDKFGEQDSLKFINSKFREIKEPSTKIIFDIANFNKSANKYKEAIKYYDQILLKIDINSALYSQIIYRRSSSYERLGDYENSDKGFLKFLEINPDDAYGLNYLAYSWLEREQNIDTALQMLERAYKARSNDPYIIDSIGWAYFLVEDYTKAENYLKRAVELMPDDPITNDHYGDILWKLGRKIQARYFWKSVLNLKETEKEMKKNIKYKLIEGLKES